MAIKYGRKKQKQNNIATTIITAVLIFVLALSMVNYFYSAAEEDAYENLHVQTKQIKDNISLQMLSDRENLMTMASFASKLYSDGEGYDIMFASFKPIGLIDSIGILHPDNSFSTKAGTVNLDGLLSFEEEKLKGEHISGRVTEITQGTTEIVRSCVPIKANNEVVGILYGAIKLDKIKEKYNTMAQELDAQLFVYEKETGDLIIDTVHEKPGNISFLQDRKYNEGYSYEQIINTDKGFSSFMSAYRNENVHMHYSAIDELGWMIALVRYDSQVFAKTHTISQFVLFILSLMIGIIILYVLILMRSERKINSVTECASNVRKELLETVNGQNNIQSALIEVCTFAKARSALFFDTDGALYHYFSPRYNEMIDSEQDRNYFRSELFRYASDLRAITGRPVNLLCIKPDKHLIKTNPEFYKFLTEHKIKDISYSATINNANHITILAVVNSERSNQARMLAEKVSACFSMALYNKNHLNRTTLAATTDSLTGALNRVAYKNDLSMFDKDNCVKFSCIYIDVNELHLRNNKYGHAAGDEMLIFIANTLKKVFFGQNIYRMGGDEFLVFCRNIEQDEVKNKIDSFLEQLKPRDYHVATGLSYRTSNINIEDMLKEAEARMYEAKAIYYQNKEHPATTQSTTQEFVQVKTGILEIDTMLSVLKEKYNGIYRVSLSTDKARRILMPAYLDYNENEEHFSSLFSKYVVESVDPDYHRALLSFGNYEALKQQLMEGKVPKITYKKNNGELVVLSVYKLCDEDELVCNTLWVFAKE